MQAASFCLTKTCCGLTDSLFPSGQSFPQPAHQSKSSLWVRRYFFFGLSQVALAPESHELYEKEFHVLC